MKRNFVLMSVCFFSLLFLTTACGKTREQHISEKYQDEYGMTKEEADEWAALESELYEAEQEWSKKEVEKEKEEEEAEEAFTLYDVSTEISSSVFSDEIVQINDSIIPNDGSLTIKDMYDILSKYGPVSIKDDGKEITADSIVQPTSGVLPLYSFVDEYGQEICHVTFVNESDQIASSYDCRVIDIGEPGYDSRNSLNFFYPGNICAVLYGVSKDIKESDAYVKRSADYTEMTFQNVEDILRSKGAMGVALDNETYKFTVYSKEPVCQLTGIEPYYRALTYNFNVDMSTAKISSLYVSAYYNVGDAVDDYIYDLSVLTNEHEEVLHGLVLEELKNGITDKCDDDITIEGYFIDDGSMGQDAIVIANTDRGTFEPVKFSIVQKFNGSIEIGDNVYKEYGGPYESVEAVLADYEIDASEYVSVQ